MVAPCRMMERTPINEPSILACSMRHPSERREEVMVASWIFVAGKRRAGVNRGIFQIKVEAGIGTRELDVGPVKCPNGSNVLPVPSEKMGPHFSSLEERGQDLLPKVGKVIAQSLLQD